MSSGHSVYISITSQGTLSGETSNTCLTCVCVFQAVCQDLEANFYEGVFPWETLKQHDAASVLKLFIRELPHPLLTVEYFNAFIAVLSMYPP